MPCGSVVFSMNLKLLSRIGLAGCALNTLKRLMKAGRVNREGVVYPERNDPACTSGPDRRITDDVGTIFESGERTIDDIAQIGGKFSRT